MSGRTVVAGIDSSTQSCKVLRVDAETGAVLASGTSAHPDGTAVDPEHWWTALVDAGGEALCDVAALSVAAQQHGMVALDADGRPVVDALLWNDTRSAPQAARMVAERGARFWAEAVGSVPPASFTITKLAWLAEQHPDLARRVTSVLLPHDWLTARLLGPGAEPVTDRSDASGTGYYSAVTGEYRHDLLEAALGHDALLPRVLAPDARAGETPYGVAVGAGAGDNAAAALGLGLRPSEVVVSVGTSATVFTSTDTRIVDPTGAVAGMADATGRQLPLLAMLNGARTITSVAGLLQVDLEEFDHLATSAPVDAGGLVLVPYLDGERTPDLPDATGSLVGMTRANLTPANLARATLLALACSARTALGELRDHGVDLSSVVLIGGAAQSEALRSTFADVIGLPLEIPEPGEYVALGAARQAAWMLSGDDEPPAWPRPLSGRREGADAPAWATEASERYAEAVRTLHGVEV